MHKNVQLTPLGRERIVRQVESGHSHSIFATGPQFPLMFKERVVTLLLLLSARRRLSTERH
jgi:hypothetical protein